MKVLFILSIATLILLAGIQLGIRAGLDLAGEQQQQELTVRGIR
jgi:hypothetical protein